MDADSLADVVDLGLHLADGGGLEVKHLEEVVGKGVDLVGHACKRLCCVTYCKEKSYQSNIQFSLKTLRSLISKIPPFFKVATVPFVSSRAARLLSH